MDKFERFINYLESNTNKRLELTFDEIEKINGEKLCKSAYKYDAYWHPSKTHVLPNYIIGAGYKIDSVELLKQKIVLIKK